MTNNWVLTLITIFVVFISCTKEKPADVKTPGEVEEISQTADELSASFAERIPQIDDYFKVNIFDLQERIKIEQDNVELRKQFCEYAFLSDKKVFVTMGIGRLHHPNTGLALARSMVERSAQMDAIRWAMYGAHWIENNFQPAFGEIKGNFTYNTQIIDKIIVGDSLFLYLASDFSKN